LRKVLVKSCKYASSPFTNESRYLDVYILLKEDKQILWHESLFLCDMAQRYTLNTIKGYANDLLSFCIMSQAFGGWKGIRVSDMTGYIHAELFQKRKYSLATIMRHVETLKKFYTWLEQKGYLIVAPDFNWSYRHLFIKSYTEYLSSSHRHSSLLSLYITHETFKKILAGVQPKSRFIKIRNQLALKLGYLCGTRASEVLTLTTSHVYHAILEAKDKNNGIWAATAIKLVGKGGTERHLYFPPSLCESVAYYIRNLRFKLPQKSDALLCTRTGTSIKDTKFASTVFFSACREANVATVGSQGYHRLRKSYGTNLVNECYESGDNPWVEIPRRLGHKSLHTTLMYIQFDALLNNRSNVLTDLKLAKNTTTTSKIVKKKYD